MLLFKRYEYNPQTDLIGKGGFSRVYKAVDKKLNRPVALKIYKPGDISERYSPIAEIQRVVELDHPNISRYIDIEEIEQEDSFGQTEKIQVCVMELLQGGNLAVYHNMHKDLEVFRKLLVDVLHGLSYLHANGIIHRDIKPANILIKQNHDGPVAKITDFGISKKSDGSSDSSSSALIVSIPYMAPEQLNAQKYGIDEKVNYNIDLWSLGVAVYEIISGDVLFKNNAGDSSEQIMNNIISSGIPDKIHTLPSPFKEFVEKCLVKDAKERIRNAEDLIKLIQPAPGAKARNISTPKKKPQKAVSPVAEINTLVPEDTVLIVKKEHQPRTLMEDTAEIVSPKVVNAADTVEIEISTAQEAMDETRIIEKVPVAIEPPIEKPPASAPAVEETILLGKPAAKDQAMVTLFNRYEYFPGKDLIGKGGFSRVYKAMDQKLSRWVALKIYKTSEFSDRYSPIAEIRRVVNLDHPNICRYLDIEEIEKINPFGEVEKIQVCVMELLDSGNFSEYFNNHGKDLTILKKLLQDVLHGIVYLHKNGIIHRDIKPANILIKSTLDGPVAKITDFGISKVSDSVNNNSSSALIVSIPYMAPEQLNTKKYGVSEKITYNLDLWSLGVTIYEVITGKVLFKNSEQESSEQVMSNIMAPELPDKIKELPQPFRDIVSCCVIKDAKERVQQAEELIRLINRPLTEDAPPPPAPIPVVPLPEPIAVPEEAETVVMTPVVKSKFAAEVIAPPTPPVKSRFALDEGSETTRINRSVANKAEKAASVKSVVVSSSGKTNPRVNKPVQANTVFVTAGTRNRRYLKIIIAAASLLVIATLFYINSGSSNTAENGINKSSIISAPFGNVSTPKATTVAGGGKDSTPNVDTVKGTTPSVAAERPVLEKPVAVTETKKAEEEKKKTEIKKEAENTSVITSGKTLLLSIYASDKCEVRKNGEYSGKIVNDNPLQIKLEAGAYTFVATTEDGRTASVTVDVSPNRLGKKESRKLSF